MKRILLAVVLTATLGKITYNGHIETWYNLNMSKVVVKAHENGIDGAYWITDDGLKMLGDKIMCAGAKERYGEVIETSRGQGIIVDYAEACKKDKDLVDIATTW